MEILKKSVLNTRKREKVKALTERIKEYIYTKEKKYTSTIAQFGKIVNQFFTKKERHHIYFG